jgi:hypothetical protein
VGPLERHRTEAQLNGVKSLKLLIQRNSEANRKKTQLIQMYVDKLTKFDRAFDKIKRTERTDDIEDTILALNMANEKYRDQVQKSELLKQAILDVQLRIGRERETITQGLQFGSQSTEEYLLKKEQEADRKRRVEEAMFR